MKKIWIGIGIAVIVVAAIVVFITQTKKEPEEIRIGAILPLTGAAAQFGEWKKRGIDIAVEEINKSGGIKGQHIQVIYEDSQGDPKTGLSALQKLMTVSKAKIIFSDLTGVTLSILPVTQKNILVITGATHPDITSGKYLALRNNITPGQEASEMAKFARERLGLKKIALLYLNDEGVKIYSQVFKETFEKLGGNTFSEIYNTGDTDFKSQLSKIKHWNPEGLYIVGWKEIGAIIRQVKELRIDAQILGATTFESPMMLSLAQGAAEGAIFTVPKVGGPHQTDKAKLFSEKYKKLFGTDPEIMTAIWYDTVHALAIGLNRSRNDPSALFEAMVKESRFIGVIGDFHFDKMGNLVMAIGFKTVKNNKFEWIKE